MKNNLKEFDNQILKDYKRILGIDEVGRGCIAGPLVVAGVILKNDFFDERIKDSKQIKSINKRKELADLIKQNCLNYEIEIFNADDVDKLNPKKASILGMNKIANKLINNYDICLTDFEKIDQNIVQLNLTKGDSKSFTIACASILAKSKRDEIMAELNNKHPNYDFLNNQGYLTTKHKDLISKFGPIKSVHRYSYKFIKEFFG